jgi:hypothetical protein
MEQLAAELGFEFIADWAFLMPVEKLIGYLEGDVGPEQRDFVVEAIVPDPKDATSIMQPHGHQPCELIDQLVIDHRGHVTLCCAVYDAAATSIGNYLELTWGEIQRMKYGHSTCDSCMHYGAHVLYTHYHQPELRKAMLELAEKQLHDDSSQHRRRAAIGLPILNSGSLAASA